MAQAERKEPRDQSETGLRSAYRAYFQSGHYDRRYPRPNLTTWRRILAHLSPRSHVLDFGCGNGRYLLPLKPHVARAAGFDISPAALEMLRERAAALAWQDLAVLGPDETDLAAYLRSEGRFDLALCLFGVLGHIAVAEARLRALQQIHEALKPEGGLLLISVPNKARRFFPEQRTAGPQSGDLIQYTRHMGDTEVTLPYQLYDRARLSRELAEAGFTVLCMRAESVLPESWLLNYRIMRWIDRLLTPFCPAGWGYGIYAEASR